MAQKYYNVAETAKILGVSADDVKKMMEGRELHGYRDGADWKFKAEDIDRLAQDRKAEQPAVLETEPADDQGGDVLLSEVALGQPALGSSGTVIAMDALGAEAAKSDLSLADSGITMADSGIALADSGITLADESPTPVAQKPEEAEAKAAPAQEMNLTLDEDLGEDSSGTLRSMTAAGSAPESSSSAIDLSGKGLEDDDLVLGGSGIGSDVSIGGDSGISLVDPADTGISLEQPLNLAGASAESLELGDGDLLGGGEAVAASSPELKADDDFLLTPMEETADTDDSSSGSQVIALDAEGEGQPGMLGGESSSSMAAMLDEDLSAQPSLDMGVGSPMAAAPLLAPQPTGLAEAAPAMQAAAWEAQYSKWQIAGLAGCAVLLLLCGMMMYDNLRNMWSWEGPYGVNSWLMDTIVGLFEGK
jgi:excisionase family DNA binding protein